MENIKTISDLTFSLSINDNQELEINNSGVSEKITIGQLKTHIASNKADVDGSNMLLDNLSSIAKENIIKTALDSLQNNQPNVIGYVRHLMSSSGSDLYIPSGGTWFVLSRAQTQDSTGVQYLYNTDDAVSTYGPLLSGGAKLLAGRAGYTAKAIVMKIQ